MELNVVKQHPNSVLEYSYGGYTLYSDPNQEEPWQIADGSGWYNGVYKTSTDALRGAIEQGGPEL